MSCSWDIYCKTCDECLVNCDVNHGEEHLGYSPIAAGASSDVVVWSQVVFEPGRLYLPPELLDAVTVEEVAKIPAYLPRAAGQMRPLIAPVDSTALDRVPADWLTRDNLLKGGRGVSFETDPIVTTYQRIRVRVRNDTDAEVQLTGAIVGKVYE